MAPLNTAVNPKSYAPYDEADFSRPKAQFVTPSGQESLLSRVLQQTSPDHLAMLTQGMTAKLPAVKRTKQGITHIGFFNQGVVTGGILLLSTVLGVAGVCSYYGFGLIRGRGFSGLY